MCSGVCVCVSMYFGESNQTYNQHTHTHSHMRAHTSTGTNLWRDDFDAVVRGEEDAERGQLRNCRRNSRDLVVLDVEFAQVPAGHH